MSELLPRKLAKLGCAAVFSLCAVAGTAADEFEGLTDPTAPLTFAVPQSAEVVDDEDDGGFFGLSLPSMENYELNSVLIRGKDRIAVVNGQRVRIGEQVGAAKVTAINHEGVVLEIDGKPRVLELYAASVKSLAAGEEP